jgi:hypothetical protein
VILHTDFGIVGLAANADLPYAIGDLNGQYMGKNRLSFEKTSPRRPLDRIGIDDGNRFDQGLQQGFSPFFGPAPL